MINNIITFLKIREVVKKFKKGKTITIRPCWYCNLSCSYCSMAMVQGKLPKFEGTLSVNEWIDLIKGFGKVREVKISGGEPMLYPHIKELVDRLCSLGYLVSMNSNLTILTPFEPNWRLIIRTTYHSGYVKDDVFTTNLKSYKEMGIKVKVFEIIRFKNSRKKMLVLDSEPNKVPSINIAPNGNVYDSCHDVQTRRLEDGLKK